MNTKQILFTAPNTAQLVDAETKEPDENEVMVKLAYTTISSGTEKANLIGDVNIDAAKALESNEPHFPRALGYSGAGIVFKIGSKVKKVKQGDRVVVCFGVHKSYCTLHEDNIVKIQDENISLSEASMAVIASFSAAGMRKTKLELGESAIVMGLGILGQFAIQFCRAAGAFPLIAIDPIASRRNYALELGADYALNPFDDDFAEQIRKITNGKGVNAAIEVTGKGKALDQVLDCMARQGRVALLGCTRDSNFSIDYYRKIHYPGIVLIGAHTSVRPNTESYPGYWAYTDEIDAIFGLIIGKRIDFKSMIAEIHSPEDAPHVYQRLAIEKDFPSVVQFDWSKIEGEGDLKCEKSK